MVKITYQILIVANIDKANSVSYMLAIYDLIKLLIYL